MRDNTNTITEIALDRLHESPFNPRQYFNDVDLQELATNIKTEGRILQPLLVRPRVPELFRGMADAADTAAVGYEIVFGHRRYRAAGLAGLATAPCMVRTMTDLEVKRAQISENLQRKDVRPLEEAAGFQALIDEHGETADSIAEQIGKGRSYVYGRLQLLALHPEVRKALQGGELGAEVALLLARLRTPKLQERALGYIKGKAWDLEDGGKRSYRSIRDLLNERFTLGLKDAPFPIEDEMLVPLAGHCMRCPKRSGNAPEYVDVVDDKKRNTWSHQNVGPDVCTDPDCFAAKKAAHQARQAEALRAKGETVIGGAKARQLVDAQGQVKGGYIALKDVKDELATAKKKVAKGVEIAPPAVVTIQDPRTGKTFKAVKADDLKAAGVKVKAPAESQQAKYAAQRARDEEQRRKRDEKAASETKVRLAVLDRTLEAMRGTPRTEVELLWMARRVFAGTGWKERELLADRHGFKSPDGLEKVLGQWPADRLGLFAVECVLIDQAHVQPHEVDRDKGELLFASAKQYGVDADAVRAAVQTPGPAADTPSTAAQAKKGAKKAVAKKTPAKGAVKPAAAGADTPSSAARATKGAKKAVEAGPGKKTKKQTDDAGVAGGSAAKVADLVDMAEAA